MATLNVLDALERVLSTNDGEPMSFKEALEKLKVYDVDYDFTVVRPHTRLISTVCQDFCRNADTRFYKDDNGRVGLRVWISEEQFDAYRQLLINKNKKGIAKRSTVSPKYKDCALSKCSSFTLLSSALNKNEILAIDTKLKQHIDRIRTVIASPNPFSAEFIQATLVAPFLEVLGYDIFNIHEIVPYAQSNDISFSYSVLRDNSVQFNVYCVAIGQDVTLDLIKTVSSAAKGDTVLITDGINYTVVKNGVAIASYSLLKEDEDLAMLIAAFHKNCYDTSILGRSLVYNNICNYLYDNLVSPSSDFVATIARALGITDSAKSLELCSESISKIGNLLRKKPSSWS